MITGYDEIYLDDAMKNLGESFDYAVNVCNIDADQYMGLFIASGISDFFERGNPNFIAGMSGTELVLNVFERAGVEGIPIQLQIEYECSPEYWSGWILAYYQWKSGKSFREIHSKVSMEDILKMYPTLHEASEDRFADAMNSIMERRNEPSKLQQQRKRSGYSQRELAEKSGVNLRTLQQYELGTKVLSRASAETVLSLANVLGCRIESII